MEWIVQFLSIAVQFLLSNSRTAFDVIRKEIFKKFGNMVVLPLMTMVWSYVWPRITDFLRNSFLGFLRKILPEPCYCLMVLVVLCCVLVGRQFSKMWTIEKLEDRKDEEQSTMPSVEAAITEFNGKVIQDVDSREGHNDAEKLLRDLNSESLKFKSTTVTHEQLVHLNNMKRILADFKDENAKICSAIMTTWEDLLRNKPTPAVKEKMPRSKFSRIRSKVEEAIFLANLLLNDCVDGFLKIGTVAATRAAAKEAFHAVKEGSVSKHNFEHTLKKMCKEGAYWGAVAGVYVGVVYGVERIRGRRDWKNAMIGGALTGAVISADRIVVDAITGGAIATAKEFLNYLT